MITLPPITRTQRLRLSLEFTKKHSYFGDFPRSGTGIARRLTVKSESYFMDITVLHTFWGQHPVLISWVYSTARLVSTGIFRDAWA